VKTDAAAIDEAFKNVAQILTGMGGTVEEDKGGIPRKRGEEEEDKLRRRKEIEGI
jgi:hypothetical protein